MYALSAERLYEGEGQSCFLSVLLIRGVKSICEKKSEIIWNAWKDVLINALQVWKWGFVKSKKVWNQIKIWTLTSLINRVTNLYAIGSVMHYSVMHYLYKNCNLSIIWVKSNVPLQQLAWFNYPYSIYSKRKRKIYCKFTKLLHVMVHRQILPCQIWFENGIKQVIQVWKCLMPRAYILGYPCEIQEASCMANVDELFVRWYEIWVSLIDFNVLCAKNGNLPFPYFHFHIHALYVKQILWYVQSKCKGMVSAGYVYICVFMDDVPIVPYLANLDDYELPCYDIRCVVLRNYSHTKLGYMNGLN